MSPRFGFTAELWRSPGPGGWHFLTLPKTLSRRMRTLAGRLNTFGSLRVRAAIGEHAWASSLFYDTRAGAFLLPVKAQVRKKAGLAAGARVRAWVEIAL